MDIEIVDDLKSTDPYAALSANQGRVLDNKIKQTNNDVSQLDTRVQTLEDNPSGGTCECETKIWTEPVA